MSNRRDFLKKLGFASLAPIVPKIATTEAVSTVTAPLIAGKINTGGLLAKIEEDKSILKWSTDGPERMRLYAGKDFITRYEQALWQGNSITNKK